MKIGSMQKDGTQSRMAISRGVGKYVTEFAVDHTKPFHYDEASSSTGQLVAIEQKTTTFSVLIFVINLTNQTAKVK